VRGLCWGGGVAVLCGCDEDHFLKCKGIGWV